MSVHLLHDKLISDQPASCVPPSDVATLFKDLDSSEHLRELMVNSQSLLSDLLTREIIVSLPPALVIDCLCTTDRHLHRLVFEIRGGFNEPDEKEAALREVARQCISRRCFPGCVVMGTEAWIAVVPHGESLDVQPRNHPSRKEAVVIFGRGNVTGGEVMSRTVSRDRLGRMVMVDDWVGMDSGAKSPILDRFFHEVAVAIGDMLRKRGAE